MKKFIKIIKRLLGVILVFIIIFFAYLMISFSPQYILGYLQAGENFADYRNYSTKEIKNSNNVFHFKKELDEEYIELLFNHKLRVLGVKTFEEYIEKTKTTALIVIRNDTIIYEKYFNGLHREDLFLAWSMTKSFVNTLIGIAIDEGYIKNVNEPITNYLPELKQRDSRFEKITIKHLLMMCSGIDRKKSELKGIPLPWDGKAIAWGHPKLRNYLLYRLDIKQEPGKQFNYINFNSELLGLILERSINKSVSKYFEEKIWKRAGMEYPGLWMLHSAESAFEIMNGGMNARPIDYARFGRLYLKNGYYDGKQVIPENWVIESISNDATINREDYYPPVPSKWLRNTHYKYHWKGHMDPDSSMNYSIGGVNGQNIFITPHKNLIIVHCGTSHKYYGVGDLWSIARLIDNPFYKILYNKGLTEAIAFVDTLIQNNQELIVAESLLNLIGYSFLYEEKLHDAIAVFKLNVRAYPLSSNVYDSLAEAYLKNGQKAEAIVNYKKSLELNPNNDNAKEMLEKLKN